MKDPARFCIFLAFLILILSHQTFPETHVPDKIQFRHITKGDGLSNTYIQCLIQDKKGFIWIGTPEGLHRYDGQKFKLFKHSREDPNSLGTGGVFALCEDKSGNLWAGTGGGGLNRYNSDQENFTRYLNPEDSSALHNFILGLFADKSGTIWAGTQYDGLFSFNAETGKSVYYKNIPDDPASVSENRIWTFYEDSKNNLWVGTLSGGLNKFDRTNKKFTRYLHNPNDPTSISFNTIAGIREDKSGNIWIATFGGGLDKITYRDNKPNPIFIHHKFDPKNPYSISSNYLVFIHIDENDVLWLGTSEEGLSRSTSSLSESSELSFISYKYDPLDKFSLLGSYVSWIYQDNSGLLWIANQGEGLNIINTNQNQFKLYSHKPDDPNSLSSNSITVVFEDKSGIVWIGTYDKGLNKWDRATNKFTHYKHNPNDPNSISNNRVTDILEDKSGILWIATYFGGLNKFDRKTEKFYAYKHNPSDSNSIREDLIISIAEDPSGILWVGTPDNGLQKFEKEKGIFTYIKYKLDDPKDFSSTYAADLYTDRSGLLWISARLDGLFSYDYQKDKFVHYENNPKNANSLDNNVVDLIFEDKSGNYWFGLAGDGLDKFDKKYDKFTHYTTKDGLPGNSIYSILEDDKSNLWMSTNKGLSVFNPQSNTFRNFDNEDGLPSPAMWDGCKSITGEYIYGCSRGLIVFHPDSLNEKIIIPPVYITDFYLFNKPVPIGYDSLAKRTILSKAIIESNEIELNYNDKVFSLEFAALDYYLPENNGYVYMMEGFDNDWISADQGRSQVTYTNLDPGEYYFRVKASDKYGNWPAAGASLKIIILPPWWKTNFAYIIYFLLTGSIIYLIWKVQLKRIRIKNEYEMSKFEAKKLQELDQIKSRFFTNISHEFRTPLTLIIGPAKRLMERAKDDTTKEDLDVIHRSARKLNKLVDELLDISKIEAGEMRLKACPLNLISVVKEIVSPFHSFAERKNIALKLNYDEEEIITFLDKDKADKILNNILSNALKFTPEGGQVEVEIKKKDKTAEIRITDTGIGIRQDQIDKIFDRFYQVDGSRTREREGTGIGLALARELIELHKGRIGVESREGKGTTFGLTFQLGRDHLKPDEIFEEDIKYEAEERIPEPEEISESKNRDKKSVDFSERSEKPSLLVVEDNTDVRKYLNGILSSRYSVIEAKDGEEGLDKSFEYLPDLIISDIMIPKIDGLQLCAKLKTDSRTSHIPVIMLTARAAIKDKIEGLETGADDYIMKPFEASELVARIKNLLGQRKRLHEHFRKYGLADIDKKKITSVDQKFIQKSIEVVYNNISSNDLGVEFLAAQLSVSKSLLNKKLSALTGDTPADFIRRIRLSRAVKLIELNAGNISEIALEVGFSNPAYFAECFRKQFGISPSQYHRNSGHNK